MVGVYTVPMTPVGSGVTGMVSAAETVRPIVPETTELPCESVTLTVKLNVPGIAEAEIVPLTLPELLRLKPPGRLPELITHVKGPTPPLFASAVEG